jgi:hypothetical protein
VAASSPVVGTLAWNRLLAAVSAFQPNDAGRTISTAAADCGDRLLAVGGSPRIARL